MDTALALMTIAMMTSLAAVAGLLLTKLFRTIRELRGVSHGLNDTLRWAVGEAVSSPAASRGPRASAPPAPR